ncbi:VOC family protein [Pseudochelatococcus sp. B33]
MKPPQAILETSIYAEDLDAAEAFYRDVFGLEVVSKLDGKFVFLRCGQQMLLVFNPDESVRPCGHNPIPRHGASGPGHLCFRATDARDVEWWREHFLGLGIAIEHDQTWKSSGGRSVYIRDPAGNSVEVAEGRIWGLG